MKATVALCGSHAVKKTKDSRRNHRFGQWKLWCLIDHRNRGAQPQHMQGHIFEAWKLPLSTWASLKINYPKRPCFLLKLIISNFQCFFNCPQFCPELFQHFRRTEYHAMDRLSVKSWVTFNVKSREAPHHPNAHPAQCPADHHLGGAPRHSTHRLWWCRTTHFSRRLGAFRFLCRNRDLGTWRKMDGWMKAGHLATVSHKWSSD